MDDLYVWLEAYGGTSYDLTSTINAIDSSLPFVSPFEWKTSIENVLDQKDDAISVIEKYGRSLPDNLPSKQIAKREYEQDVLFKLATVVNVAAAEMGLTLDDITSADQLQNVVLTMTELIDMLIHNDEESFQKAFDDHEDANDDSFEETLGVDARDLVQLSRNVQQIRNIYYMTLDDNPDDE